MKMDIELETYVEQIMDKQITRNGIFIGFSNMIANFVYGVSLFRGSIDERLALVLQSRRL